MATDFLFTRNNIFSFTSTIIFHFFETVIAISHVNAGRKLNLHKTFRRYSFGRRIFKKKSYLRTLIQMEPAFWSTEIVSFNESFIVASGNGFCLIKNLLLLLRAFLSWRAPFLKLNVGQFLGKNIIPAR